MLLSLHTQGWQANDDRVGKPETMVLPTRHDETGSVMNHTGIDVSAREVHVHMLEREMSAKFANDPAGHKQLVKWLRKHAKRKPVRVSLEATGIYHFDLAVALAEADGVEVMVLNPRAARRFAEAMMQRSKDDPLDARMLAQYVTRMPFQPWQVPEANVLKLRAFSRRITQLVQARTVAKNQLHSLHSSAHTPPELLDDGMLSVRQLDAQITALRSHARALIDSDEQLAKPFELLCSVPGIAEASAISLLGELLVLPDDMNCREWVAFAGLDPRHERSGTSVNKPARISKAGNAYLRHALYLPAVTAATRDPHVQAYYQALLARRGFKKIQAVCAVMRKLLHALHGMLRTGTSFQGHRFYAAHPEAA